GADARPAHADSASHARGPGASVGTAAARDHGATTYGARGGVWPDEARHATGRAGALVDTMPGAAFALPYVKATAMDACRGSDPRGRPTIESWRFRATCGHVKQTLKRRPGAHASGPFL